VLECWTITTHLPQKAFIVAMLTTKTKIKIASVLSRFVRAARRSVNSASDNVQVNRDGITWRLDLKEGIDFGIFLGLYERSTKIAIRRWVRTGFVALDIGANIGTHSLELARQVGATGAVFAFEPTIFAYSKLLNHLALNPILARTVKAERLLLAASDDRLPVVQVYSSWPLIHEVGLHAIHAGRSQSTDGARIISLDTYLNRTRVQTVDFIKLDVDGFECEVLEGGQECLEKFRPTILMELAPYCLRERGASLERLVDLLACRGYRFAKLNGEELPIDARKLDRKIAEGASMNVIARRVA
jgi:FkbM family methyltransferase